MTETCELLGRQETMRVEALPKQIGVNIYMDNGVICDTSENP